MSALAGRFSDRGPLTSVCSIAGRTRLGAIPGPRGFLAWPERALPTWIRHRSPLTAVARYQLLRSGPISPNGVSGRASDRVSAGLSVSGAVIQHTYDTVGRQPEARSDERHGAQSERIELEGMSRESAAQRTHELPGRWLSATPTDRTILGCKLDSPGMRRRDIFSVRFETGQTTAPCLVGK